MKLGAALLLLGYLSTAASPALAAARELMEQAREASPQRVAFAEAQQAEIKATEGARSFYIYWAPEGYDPIRGVLVTLHGHGSWAYDEFFLWKTHAEKKGMAILALQWWLGEGEETSGYLTPDEMYAEIDRILRRKKVKPGKVLLHGFSRGSANTYALAALDRHSGNRFFKGVISNAGGASRDYFPNKQIDLGMMGPEPFKGLGWVLYCGGKDPNPERDGCAAMSRTKSWVEKHGAKVLLFMRDLTADHGGFHRKGRRADEALSIFVI